MKLKGKHRLHIYIAINTDKIIVWEIHMLGLNDEKNWVKLDIVQYKIAKGRQMLNRTNIAALCNTLHCWVGMYRKNFAQRAES